MKIPIELYIDISGTSSKLVLKYLDNVVSETISFGTGIPQPYAVVTAFQDMMHSQGSDIASRITTLEDRIDTIKEALTGL